MGWETFQSSDEERLKAVLTDMAGRAKTEVNYSATRFLEMLNSQGAQQTVRSLLSSPHPSDGFTNMVLAGRPDLTLERVIQDEPWRSFLTQDEISVARARTGPRG